ncbi:MAG: tetratricopeptide repeat protein [Bryobacteraceae bacterium]
MARNLVVCVFLITLLTSCSFFGEQNSEAAATRRPAAPVSSVTLNYSAFTAAQWLNLSRTLYSEGKYLESIGAAQTALHLKPDYAEAYNNIGAAYAALRLWDPAIQADQQAVHLMPGMQLARNNLAWALQQKSREKH